MKKIIALLLLLPVQVYAMSDCANKPTCEEIGYSHNEYACDQKLTTPCAFDSSKVYCPGPVCEPGYFLYSDGSCSLSLKSDKTVIGIVFDKDWRLALATSTVTGLRWANNAADTLDENGKETIIVPDLICKSYAYETPCTINCNGYENTKKIIDYAKANNYVFPAAEYCYNFTTSGKGKGNWWLPSDAELRKIYHSISAVNNSMNILGKADIPTGWFWASEQSSGDPAYVAWHVNIYNNQASHLNKRSTTYTLCVTRY